MEKINLSDAFELIGDRKTTLHDLPTETEAVCFLMGYNLAVDRANEEAEEKVRLARIGCGAPETHYTSEKIKALLHRVEALERNAIMQGQDVVIGDPENGPSFLPTKIHKVCG